MHAKVLGQKYHFGFFSIQKGVWPYRYANDVPLVTLILNIYGFVGPAPLFFLAKSTVFVVFFLIQKGVWPYRHAHDIPLVTLG